MGCCQIAEGNVNGVASVTLENDHIKVVVLPGKGTDICEFRHKASDTDVFWKAPWGIKNPATHVPDTSGSEAMFLDLYHGGWQELFPNGGSSCIYKGSELGFHGEICKTPWQYHVLQETEYRVVVRFHVRTARTPFRVEKTLRVEHDKPALFIEETVTNEGAIAMDFMWGHHPAFGPPLLSKHSRLFLRAGSVETAQAMGIHPVLPPETRFNTFPVIKAQDGSDFDLSRMLPASAGIANLAYISDLDDGWYCLVNEKTRLGFALRWDSRVFRYVWLWQEFCGTREYPWWGQAYLVGIEPQSSIPSLGLERAIARGTQLTLEPGSSLSTEICASMFRAEGEPVDVFPDGRVKYG
jgi:galactose mutarotase-like enzyme